MRQHGCTKSWSTNYLVVSLYSVSMSIYNHLNFRNLKMEKKLVLGWSSSGNISNNVDTEIMKLQSWCKQLPCCSGNLLCHKAMGNICLVFVCLKRKVYGVLHFTVNIHKIRLQLWSFFSYCSFKIFTEKGKYLWIQQKMINSLLA